MKHAIYGVSASIAMAAVYFGIVSYFNSFSHAVSQYVSLWPFMTLLIAGFGAQAGLFSYIREKSIESSGGVAVASGTVSTGSMVACCAHHISDVLPFLGLSFAAAFVDRYQSFFLLLGIISNIVGFLSMLRLMHRRKIRFDKKSIFKRIMKYDLDGIYKASLAAGAVLLLFIFVAL